MASTCDICGKVPEFGNSVSHSHLKTKRRWNPNIQRVRTVVNGTPKKVNACVTCIKSNRVTKRKF
ncbi:MAG: 50S ribosomal protein L28 [Bifidobacteriaceae bacterium]|nr:50S ribosomal protein L28 [Bifidobacteriaceae bacterium]